MKLILILLISAISLLASKIEVTASIVPQKYFIEKIAKDKVLVNVMVKSGFSPAIYEPKTSQMKRLMNSKAYFAIGVPFENIWLEKFSSINKNMLVVDTSKGIKKLEMTHHEHHEEHHEENHDEDGKDDEHHDEDEKDEHHDEHHDEDEKDNEKHNNHESGLDPHIWLDPILVKIQAKNILDALISLDTENSNFYKKNYEDFIEELDLLNSDIKKILKKNKNSPFMVFHPSWQYFANRYNLEQIAVEKEGKEPKAKELKNLINEAHKHNIKVIFVAPQFSQKAAQTIAKSLDANVVIINHLKYNYKENLLHIAKTIHHSYK